MASKSLFASTAPQNLPNDHNFARLRATSSATPHQVSGFFPFVNPFQGVYPPQRHLDPAPKTEDPDDSKTEEEAIAEIEEDVETFKAALRERQQQLSRDFRTLFDGKPDPVTAEKWKREEFRMGLEVILRIEQYHLMLIAGWRHDNGDTK